jgi:hypothetical protein
MNPALFFCQKVKDPIVVCFVRWLSPAGGGRKANKNHYLLSGGGTIKILTNPYEARLDISLILHYSVFVNFYE